MITQEEQFRQGIRQREYTLINQDNLQDPIVGGYCECTVGARTVDIWEKENTLNIN